TTTSPSLFIPTDVPPTEVTHGLFAGAEPTVGSGAPASVKSPSSPDDAKMLTPSTDAVCPIILNVRFSFFDSPASIAPYELLTVVTSPDTIALNNAVSNAALVDSGAPQ